MTQLTFDQIRKEALRKFFDKWDRLTDPNKDNRQPGREILKYGSKNTTPKTND